MTYITTKQAAVIIGCSVQHVRSLVRTNKLPATKVPLLLYRGVTQYQYQILKTEAEQFARHKQTVGYPRGKGRTK